MKKKITLIYSWFVSLILSWLPDTPITMRFRGFLYSLVINECGKNFQVSNGVIFRGLEKLRIGNNVYIGPRTIVFCNGWIDIQDEVLIGPYCVIVSGNHSSHLKSFRFNATVSSPISIGKGSWVSANCTITAGAIIKKNVLIAANSCVTGKTQESSVYGGVPAKFIKTINDEI